MRCEAQTLDVGLFTSTSTISLANQETRLLVGDVRVTISVETLVLKCPLVGELADSARNDLRQVAEDVLRVTASQLGFTAERQVVTHKNRCAKSDGSRKAFVMCVTQAHNRRIILRRQILPFNAEQAEITLAVTSESVRLLFDSHLGRVESATHLINQVLVRDRCPSLGALGCFNRNNRITLNRVCATM